MIVIVSALQWIARMSLEESFGCTCLITEANQEDGPFWCSGQGWNRKKRGEAKGKREREMVKFKLNSMQAHEKARSFSFSSIWSHRHHFRFCSSLDSYCFKVERQLCRLEQTGVARQQLQQYWNNQAEEASVVVSSSASSSSSSSPSTSSSSSSLSARNGIEKVADSRPVPRCLYHIDIERNCCPQTGLSLAVIWFGCGLLLTHRVIVVFGRTKSSNERLAKCDIYNQFELTRNRRWNREFDAVMTNNWLQVLRFHQHNSICRQFN